MTTMAVSAYSRLWSCPGKSCVGHLMSYALLLIWSLGSISCAANSTFILPPQPADNPYPKLLHERDVIHYVDTERHFSTIGSGAFGDVTIGELRGSGAHVVVKTFKDSSFHSIVKEIRMHRYVEQLGVTPYLIGLLPTGPLAANISLVFEYVPFSKDVHDWLDEPDDLTTIQWLHVCLQTALTLRHLHQHKVLFNDLHRGNILVQKCGDGIKVYFIDFGLATYTQGKLYSSSYGSLQGYKFLAPELGRNFSTTEASDVFALGYNFLKITKAIPLNQLFHLAHWCMAPEPENRPDLPTIIARLHSILFELNLQMCYYPIATTLDNMRTNESSADINDVMFTKYDASFGFTNCLECPATCARSTDSLSKFGQEDSSNWAWLTQSLLSERCHVHLSVLDEYDLLPAEHDSIDWLAQAEYDAIRFGVMAQTNETVIVKEFYKVSFLSIREETCVTAFFGHLGVAPKITGVLIEYKNMYDIAFVQEFYGNGISLKDFISDSKGYDWNITALEEVAKGDLDLDALDNWSFESRTVCRYNLQHSLLAILRMNSRPVCPLKSYRHRIFEHMSYLLCQRMNTVHQAGYLINNFRVNNVLVKWTDTDRGEEEELVDVKLIDLGSTTPMSRGRKLRGHPKELSRFSYLAPEVAQGRRSTRSSDIYSLCVILYQLMEEYVSLIDVSLRLGRFSKHFHHAGVQNKTSAPSHRLQLTSCSRAGKCSVSDDDLTDFDLPFQRYQHVLRTCLSQPSQKRPSLQDLITSLRTLLKSPGVFEYRI